MSERIERALVSVSNKEGIVEFAKGLASHGVQILSTGGTARTLRDAGLDVVVPERLPDQGSQRTVARQA